MWEIILWSSVTFTIFLAIILLIYYLFSFRMVKARRGEIVEMNDSIKPGKKCTFNGIHGKLVSVGNETCEVEVSKGIVITISRYIINSIEA